MAKLSEAGIVLLIAFGASAIAYTIFERRAPRSPSPRMNQIADGIAAGIILLFGLIFCAITLRRYETQSFFGDDFTFFYQAIWNSQRGRLFENTAYLDSPTFLGHHFSPILLTFVPLFAFENSPRIFSAIPAIAITTSAIPLYWFARQQLGRVLAIVVLVSFFLAPITQYMGTYQFYDSILAVPWLMFAMFFVMRQRYTPFLICVALALMVKEDIAVVVIGLGFFIAIVQRKIIPGFTLAVVGLITLLVLLQWVIPFFHGGTNYYFFGGTPDRPGFNLYGYLGNSLGEVVLNALTHPDLVLQHILIEPKIEAVIYLFVPLGLVPLIGFEVAALTFPMLAYILLSDLSHVYSPNNYHYAPLIPFLFFGLVIGMRRIVGINQSRVTIAASVFVIGSNAAAAFVFNQGQPFAIIDPNRFPITAHTARAEPIARAIPARAAVMAVTELMPLISERQSAYIFPSIPCLGAADYIFTDTQRPWFSYRKDMWAELLALPLFETVIDQDGYILNKRVAPTNRVNANFGDQITLLGHTPNITGTLIGNTIWQPALTWRTNKTIRDQFTRVARVSDARDHTWAIDATPLGGKNCETKNLNAGTEFGDLLQIALPPTMPRGQYRLTVALADRQNQIISQEIYLTALALEKNTASFTASELKIEMPLFVDMGDLRFLGSNFFPTEIARGENFAIGLYWRARVKPRGDYRVTVELRDSAGRIAVEHTDRPAAGAYPTTQWTEGEVLLDWHDVIIPASTTPGEYIIHIKLINASNALIGETPLAKIFIKSP